MPTIARIGPFRFFFYSSDRNEPRHVHVERDAAAAKYWLEPVSLAWASGFTAQDMNKIERIIVESAPEFIREWNDFFGA